MKKKQLLRLTETEWMYICSTSTLTGENLNRLVTKSLINLEISP